MAAQLQRDGIPIDRKTARKYMQEMDLLAIYPKPNLSRPHPDHRIYPYLLRDITPAYPNHVWSSDITYIRLRDGWLFLQGSSGPFGDELPGRWLTYDELCATFDELLRLRRESPQSLLWAPGGVLSNPFWVDLHARRD